ncbi:MAG: hypothetical protein ABF893_08490, partial [Gluconacetobacter liquefaciens]
RIFCPVARRLPRAARPDGSFQTGRTREGKARDVLADGPFLPGRGGARTCGGEKITARLGGDGAPGYEDGSETG